MRLLHYDSLDRLILTDFRGKLVPPYAILSHRWGDSEVLYEDVLHQKYKFKKGGYQKLRFCAEQAARDGLQYFWIDTCCIDRWNTDERSRAIQSMFRWYCEAARCYVFLSDVSLPAEASINTVSGGDWKLPFCASAWFTRGWTLQELIAPASVEFFSSEGQRLGDKASLDQLIHHITNIPLAALRNSDLDQFSISERKEWSKNRTTTEEEDIVYCLLGILGVTMPATYGEGLKSAQRRLQDEIERNCSAPSFIPFSQNESFVGRERQVAELEAKLFSNKHTSTVLAVVGPSGTGKSQLALEVAHRARTRNRECSVFWIDASDKDSISRAYASVARKLCIPGCNDDKADAKQVVKRCVSELKSRQCLIIFDSAERTFAGLSSSSWRVATLDLAVFLPRSRSCSVIFTTTDSSIAATRLAEQNVMLLRELTPTSALEMLRNSLAMPISDAEHQDAIDLVEDLSHLPLAIAQASACMNATSMKVQHYRARLAEHKEVGRETPKGQSEGELRESGLRSSVAATLFLSISQIRYTNVLAERYLFLAACIDQRDIPLEFLGPASPTQAHEAAVKALDKYALIIRRPSESALDVHHLVHSALRERLQAEGSMEAWNQRTAIQLVSVFPRDDHASRSKWRRLIPHVQYLLNHTQWDDKAKLDLAGRCAMALLTDGRYEESEELEVKVKEVWEKEIGDKNLRTLLYMGNLALVYSKRGQFEKAKELEEKVMATTKKALGDKHPRTLVTMGNLACTYQDLGLLKESEELHVQVLETRRAVLSDKHPDTLHSIDSLALTYRDQGRWKEAEELWVQAINGREEVIGVEHADTLNSKGNLALLYRDQRRWKEAERLELQVKESRKKVLGDQHPDTLAIEARVASTYRDEGGVKLRVRAEYLFWAVGDWLYYRMYRGVR